MLNEINNSVSQYSHKQEIQIKNTESKVFLRIEEKPLLTVVSARLYDKNKFNKPK